MTHFFRKPIIRKEPSKAAQNMQTVRWKELGNLIEALHKDECLQMVHHIFKWIKACDTSIIFSAPFLSIWRQLFCFFRELWPRSFHYNFCVANTVKKYNQLACNNSAYQPPKWQPIYGIGVLFWRYVLLLPSIIAHNLDAGIYWNPSKTPGP